MPRFCCFLEEEVCLSLCVHGSKQSIFFWRQFAQFQSHLLLPEFHQSQSVSSLLLSLQFYFYMLQTKKISNNFSLTYSFCELILLEDKFTSKAAAGNFLTFKYAIFCVYIRCTESSGCGWSQGNL
jgi:hypothetical protein